MTINSQEISMERLGILKQVRKCLSTSPSSSGLTNGQGIRTIKVLDLCARVDVTNVAFAVIKPEDRAD